MGQARLRARVSIISCLAACGLISLAESAVAQDGWNPFASPRRERPVPPAPLDGSGVRPGDRPLEMPGEPGEAGPERLPRTDRRDDRYGGSQGYGDRGGPPGAGAVSVERGELAPIQVPPEPPPPLPRAADADRPARWDRGPPGPPATAPPPWGQPQLQRDRVPPSRDVRPPMQPSRLQVPPDRRPPVTVAAPSLSGLSEIDAKVLEDIVAGLELPPKSAAIASLWPRIWAEAGRGAPLSPAFEAIRIETLTRSGDIDALGQVLQRLSPPSAPVMAIVAMRARLLVGDRESGCALAGEAIRNRTALPASFRRDAVLAAGYCAIVGGNAEAAKLTADLIRGEKIDAPFALAVLEGAGAGGKAPPALPKTVTTLDYRIGEAAGVVWPSDLIERAEPGLLGMLATAPMLDPGLRAVAAERAARLNMLPPDGLAAQYRDIPHAADDLAQPLATRQTGALRRSLLARAAEEERAPDRKARNIRALLDEAGQIGLRSVVARMLGPTVASLPPQPELGWFAETAVEILVQSGRTDAARAWIAAGRGALDGWRLLAAIAEGGPPPPGGYGFAEVERLAQARRFEPVQLHRLVTVLDALDYQMPIPLWEAASRTPQPTDGHLPPTGVLAELKSARDKRDGARTILRAAQALGPADATGANLLTLGDVIRALKGAGFEREARVLGLEALVAAWPRSVQR